MFTSRLLFSGMFLAGLTAAVPDADGMIVGGHSINISEAPWQVKLDADGGGCGATWIGGRWIVTAAHCVEGADAAKTYIWAGITSLSKEMNNTNRVAAKRIISQPLYASQGDADIALIELNADITNAKARFIAMVTPEQARAGLTSKGVECMASGWGFMDPHYTKSPDTLRAVTSKIYDTSKYQIRWAGNGKDTVGSCMGDSGGPLVVKDANGQWIFAGISSSIPGGGATLICGNPNGPPNYTRVSAFHAWVIGITGTLPTALNGGPGDARIAFPAPGQFRLAAPGVLETALFNMSGARVGGDRRFYSAGIHALPAVAGVGGNFVLRIRGNDIQVTRALRAP